MINEIYMDIAYKEALKSLQHDEIPVGCIIVKNNEIISKGHNCKEKKKNCTMHAELIAINRACKKTKNWRLDGCIIYSTLEPCMMCMGAIIESRIKKIYYGTKIKNEHMYDNLKIIEQGFIINCLNDNKCSEILSNFFKMKRKK